MRLSPSRFVGVASCVAKIVASGCDLLQSDFPKDFYFSVRVPLCTNVVDKQARTIS